MFKLNVCALDEVPAAQRQYDVTKILTLIEPWYTVPYDLTEYDPSIYRIGVADKINGFN